MEEENEDFNTSNKKILNTATGEVGSSQLDQSVEGTVPTTPPSVFDNIQSLQQTPTNPAQAIGGADFIDYSNIDSEYIDQVSDDSGFSELTANNLAAESQGWWSKLGNATTGGVLKGVVSATSPFLTGAGNVMDALDMDYANTVRGFDDMVKDEISKGLNYHEKDLSEDASLLDKFMRFSTVESIAESTTQFAILGNVAGMGIRGMGGLMLRSGAAAEKIGMSAKVAEAIQGTIGTAGRLMKNPVYMKGVNAINSNKLMQGLASNYLEGVVMADELESEMRGTYASVLYDPTVSSQIKTIINEEIQDATNQLQRYNTLLVVNDLLGFSRLGDVMNKSLGRMAQKGLKGKIPEWMLKSDVPLLSASEGGEEMLQNLLSSGAEHSNIIDMENRYAQLSPEERYGQKNPLSPDRNPFQPEDFLLWQVDPSKAKEVALDNARTMGDFVLSHAFSTDALVEGLSGMVGGGPQWLLTRAPGKLVGRRQRKANEKATEAFFDKAKNIFEEFEIEKLKTDAGLELARQKLEQVIPGGAENEYLSEVLNDYVADTTIIDAISRGKVDEMTEALGDHRRAIDAKLQNKEIDQEQYDILRSRNDRAMDSMQTYRNMAAYGGSEELLSEARKLAALKAARKAEQLAKEQIASKITEEPIPEQTMEDDPASGLPATVEKGEGLTTTGDDYGVKLIEKKDEIKLIESNLQNEKDKGEDSTESKAKIEKMTQELTVASKELVSLEAARPDKGVAVTSNELTTTDNIKEAQRKEANKDESRPNQPTEEEAKAEREKTIQEQIDIVEANIRKIMSPRGQIDALRKEREYAKHTKRMRRISNSNSSAFVQGEMRKLDEEILKAKTEKEREIFEDLKAQAERRLKDLQTKKKTTRKKDKQTQTKNTAGENTQTTQTTETTEEEIDDFFDGGMDLDDDGLTEEEKDLYNQPSSNETDVPESESVTDPINSDMSTSQRLELEEEEDPDDDDDGDDFFDLTEPMESKDSPEDQQYRKDADKDMTDVAIALAQSYQGPIQDIKDSFIEATNQVKNILAVNGDDALDVADGDDIQILHMDNPLVFERVSDAIGKYEQIYLDRGLEGTFPQFDEVLGAVATSLSMEPTSIKEAVQAAYSHFTKVAYSTVVSANKVTTTEIDDDSQYEPVVRDYDRETSASLDIQGNALAWDGEAIRDYRSIKRGTGVEYHVMTDEEITNATEPVPKDIPAFVTVGADIVSMKWSAFLKFREEANDPKYKAKAIKDGTWTQVHHVLQRAGKPDNRWVYSDQNARPISVRVTSGPKKGAQIGYVHTAQWTMRQRYDKDNNAVPANVMNKMRSEVARMRAIVAEATKEGTNLRGKITNRQKNIKVTDNGYWRGTAIKMSNAKRFVRTADRLGTDPELLYSVISANGDIDDTTKERILKHRKKEYRVPPHIKPGATVVLLPIENSNVLVAQNLKTNRELSLLFL
jgi:hypothetical protein